MGEERFWIYSKNEAKFVLVSICVQIKCEYADFGKIQYCFKESIILKINMLAHFD